MRLDVDPAWRAWLVDDEIHAYCDEGWRELLHGFFAAFHDVLVHEPQARVKVLQVKEKFAGLRVYWRVEGVSPACSAQLVAIDRRFEDLSYRTCETCGRSGELRKRGRWYSTRCGDHLPRPGSSFRRRPVSACAIRAAHGRSSFPRASNDTRTSGSKEQARDAAFFLRPEAPPLDRIFPCR